MQTVGHKKSCNLDCPPVTASQRRRRQREEGSKMLAEPVLEAEKEKLAKKDNAAQKLDNKQPQPLTTIVPSLLAVPSLSTQNSCSGSCASGGISGKRRKTKNPLLTYEVNKKFLRIVERAAQQEVWNHKEILRWTDDTDKDLHHHVESYVQSFPRMAKLLAVHDPPPSTSKLFERAWHHVLPGPTEAAGDYFTYGQG
ncbi:hypothetical protein CEUSTIGMA_g7680.t1 [Chlamydomonas eustigma]|uniref:Uncharacterized protein n=1 Tax=Chlamydomonas eustigma TaxID=1157962 RepID=A0A250XBI9_9CHLO|nr:hypothetical protein CEUSTIGMA_g7680.t1 [Chlamydomonas eustigma]|eukprot:GAX80242.1 hypothetical protein CEUSTIGMA_g7680.t1 [Chlamydomonas eustigma]